MFATVLELLSNNQLGRVTSCLICFTACMAYADLANQSVLAHCFCAASMLILALLLSALLKTRGKCLTLVMLKLIAGHMWCSLLSPYAVCHFDLEGLPRVKHSMYLITCHLTSFV